MFGKIITVQFTVQNEEDFFASLEEGMMSDQGGYSSYTALDSSDDPDSSNQTLFQDQIPATPDEVMQAVREVTDQIVANCEKKLRAFSRREVIDSISHPWRLLYGELLENEVLSNSYLNLEETLADLEDSFTPYCVLEFVEGSGWKCYADFMEGEEIYYTSLFDQPE